MNHSEYCFVVLHMLAYMMTAASGLYDLPEHFYRHDDSHPGASESTCPCRDYEIGRKSQGPNQTCMPFPIHRSAICLCLIPRVCLSISSRGIGRSSSFSAIRHSRWSFSHCRPMPNAFPVPPHKIEDLLRGLPFSCICVQGTSKCERVVCQLTIVKVTVESVDSWHFGLLVEDMNFHFQSIYLSS